MRLWVYDSLLKFSATLEEKDASVLAENVNGNGSAVLQYDEEEWEKQVPGYGILLYIRSQRSQKYVASR